MAVLADCLDRAAGEEPADRAYQRDQHGPADHLGMLHARWADLVKTADRNDTSGLAPRRRARAMARRPRHSAGHLAVPDHDRPPNWPAWTRPRLTQP